MRDINPLIEKILLMHNRACTHIDNGEEMEAKDTIISATEMVLQCREMLRKPDPPVGRVFSPQPKPERGKKR